MSEKIKEEIAEEKVCACENCTCEEGMLYELDNSSWGDLDITLDNSEFVNIVGTNEQKIALFAALSNFYAKVQNPENTKTNDYLKNKYAPLDTILECVRPLLGEEGLFVSQAPSTQGEVVSVQSIILHKAGGLMSFPRFSANVAKGGNFLQNLGSAITYAKRYAISSILGIAGQNEDDDGNGDTKKSTAKKEPTTSKVKQLTQAIMAKIKANKELQPAIGEIIKQYTTDGSAIKENIPEEKIDEVISKLKELK